jgi:hypothetical protein
MPVCFQLFKKGSDVPSRFCDIDEEICREFGWTVDEKLYAHGWYDSIGFQIATGKDLGGEELRNRLKEYYDENDELLRILSFLEEHYTSTAWYERKDVRG